MEPDPFLRPDDLDRALALQRDEEIRRTEADHRQKELRTTIAATQAEIAQTEGKLEAAQASVFASTWPEYAATFPLEPLFDPVLDPIELERIELVDRLEEKLSRLRDAETRQLDQLRIDSDVRNWLYAELAQLLRDGGRARWPTTHQTLLELLARYPITAAPACTYEAPREDVPLDPYDWLAFDSWALAPATDREPQLAPAPSDLNARFFGALHASGTTVLRAIDPTTLRIGDAEAQRRLRALLRPVKAATTPANAPGPSVLPFSAHPPFLFGAAVERVTAQVGERELSYAVYGGPSAARVQSLLEDASRWSRPIRETLLWADVPEDPRAASVDLWTELVLRGPLSLCVWTRGTDGTGALLSYALVTWLTTDLPTAPFTRLEHLHVVLFDGRHPSHDDLAGLLEPVVAFAALPAVREDDEGRLKVRHRGLHPPSVPDPRHWWLDDGRSEGSEFYLLTAAVWKTLPNKRCLDLEASRLQLGRVTRTDVGWELHDFVEYPDRVTAPDEARRGFRVPSVLRFLATDAVVPERSFDISIDVLQQERDLVALVRHERQLREPDTPIFADEGDRGTLSLLLRAFSALQHVAVAALAEDQHRNFVLSGYIAPGADRHVPEGARQSLAVALGLANANDSTFVAIAPESQLSPGGPFATALRAVATGQLAPASDPFPVEKRSPAVPWRAGVRAVAKHHSRTVRSRRKDWAEPADSTERLVREPAVRGRWLHERCLARWNAWIASNEGTELLRERGPDLLNAAGILLEDLQWRLLSHPGVSGLDRYPAAIVAATVEEELTSKAKGAASRPVHQHPALGPRIWDFVSRAGQVATRYATVYDFARIESSFDEDARVLSRAVRAVLFGSDGLSDGAARWLHLCPPPLFDGADGAEAGSRAWLGRTASFAYGTRSAENMPMRPFYATVAQVWLALYAFLERTWASDTRLWLEPRDVRVSSRIFATWRIAADMLDWWSFGSATRLSADGASDVVYGASPPLGWEAHTGWSFGYNDRTSLLWRGRPSNRHEFGPPGSPTGATRLLDAMEAANVLAPLPRAPVGARDLRCYLTLARKALGALAPRLNARARRCDSSDPVYLPPLWSYLGTFEPRNDALVTTAAWAGTLPDGRIYPQVAYETALASGAPIRPAMRDGFLHDSLPWPPVLPRLGTREVGNTAANKALRATQRVAAHRLFEAWLHEPAMVGFRIVLGAAGDDLLDPSGKSWKSRPGFVVRKPPSGRLPAPPQWLRPDFSAKRGRTTGGEPPGKKSRLRAKIRSISLAVDGCCLSARCHEAPATLRVRAVPPGEKLVRTLTYCSHRCLYFDLCPSLV